MAKYRKKPVVIEAIQYNGDNKQEILRFAEGKAATNTCYEHLTIFTLEGNHRANVGDWIVKGVANEFYPVKPDIFAKTYEKVE